MPTTHALRPMHTRILQLPQPKRHGKTKEMMKHILSYAKLKILIETNKHYNPSFKELKTLLQTTDGNLASFTRQLQNQKLIKKHKHFKNQKPYTQYSITPLGIFALQENKQFLTELLEELK